MWDLNHAQQSPFQSTMWRSGFDHPFLTTSETSIYLKMIGIVNFLNSLNTIASHQIDQGQENSDPEQQMVQLRSNKIPRGLVPLEKLLDDSVAFKGSKVTESYFVCCTVA